MITISLLAFALAALAHVRISHLDHAIRLRDRLTSVVRRPA